MVEQKEVFSRVHIDRLLEASGWDVANPNQVKLESSGVKGIADYILMGKYIPLCVLEAKKPSEDPYNAKNQARKYAEEAKAPFIILSNGKEHWFWDLTNKQDAYRIERFPSRDELELRYKRNLHPPSPLFSLLEKDYFSEQKKEMYLRGYQLKAIEELTKQFDLGKRSFLIEMATGTGKTVLTAAIIRRFLETRNAIRVLFIVDRIELATQAIETFKELLRDYNPVLYKQVKNKPNSLWGSSIIVATIQSLMTGRRFKNDFTPFHFDLVINDEAHRSIYGGARECIQYFQAIRIGLTATPKGYLKNINIHTLEQTNPKYLEARRLRDTYNFFGCESGKATFRYDLLEAVKDPAGPFLCLPQIWDLRSDITTKCLEEKGWIIDVNGEEETFKISDLERKIFTPKRNELMCKTFLEKAKKSPDEQIGKSIIFTVNQKHATSITKILNSITPGIALTITSNIKDSSDIAKQFRKDKRSERIAVTVDMLSTGYDCSEILNIGLMRPIFSPSHYIQIKGRGTRLYTWNLQNKEYHKKSFAILDFCAVSEYFEEKYDYTCPLPVSQLNEKTNHPTNEFFFDSLTTSSSSCFESIPVWEGSDVIAYENLKTIGPNGEKVDIFTFIRGAFEQDIQKFSEIDSEFKQAVEEEDEDKIEQILNEKFFNRPKMFYNTSKLIDSYQIPATSADFVYHALNKKKIISLSDLLQNLGNSLASKNNLGYSESKWITLITETIADNPNDLQKFTNEDPLLYEKVQFRTLGGIDRLYQLPKVLSTLNELRQTYALHNLNQIRR